MPDYDYQRQQCDVCMKINICVHYELRWYCQACFTWKIGHAKTKDYIIAKMQKIYVDNGIEDLEA